MVSENRSGGNVDFVPGQSVLVLGATGSAGQLAIQIAKHLGTGADIALPSAALRQVNIHFLGSGQGSVTARDIVGVLPAVVEEIDRGSFSIDAVSHPLAEVGELWNSTLARSTERIVFAPNG